MTSWSKSQYKRIKTLAPHLIDGDKGNKKEILNEALDEEYEKELKEFICGNNSNGTKRKISRTS